MSEDSNGNKPTTSSNIYSTPSPSQCAAVPPSASKSKTPKAKDKNGIVDFLERAKFIKAVEQDREDYEDVLHRKRMADVLTEVKFLEETSWMYPTLEGIYGFKDERPITLATRYESAANLAEAHMFRVARSADRNS